ncbi:MAG TPA: tetraacyldisaccharide 4'-kinase [Pseudolabrys sp.]
MRDPAFWWRKPGLASGLLSPFAAVYGAVAAARMAGLGDRAGLPVICVGNFTLGGAGKTPAVMWLAKMLQEAGERPFCLSRGYGGSAAGPLFAAADDSASDVGDEALLLARVTPAVVARDRVAGAKFAKAQDATVVIMDDGLQNASLAKDFTIAVVDGRRGIGNARVFPAGPLRAPLDAQLKRCDALLIIGDADGAIPAAGKLPVFHGRLVPDAATIVALKSKNVMAFAGIGDPEKFFATLTQAGIAVAERKAFADHHRFTAGDAAALLSKAARDGLTLVTTQKDRARMAGDPALAALAAGVQVLPVTLAVDEADQLRKLVLLKTRR